jgi:hypothetical protein
MTNNLVFSIGIYTNHENQFFSSHHFYIAFESTYNQRTHAQHLFT